MFRRHLVITGASTGIGRATVNALADRFERITLVGRSPERHQPVMAELTALGAEATLAECDLRSLASVSAAARRIHGDIDVVIANAGVGGGRGSTDDGFELHFGVNHLAHHLLVNSLAGRIRDRVVIVSSNAHFDAAEPEWDRLTSPTRSFTGFPEYRFSKLANVWCGRQLAVRHGFATYVVHPGLVASDIWRRIPTAVRPWVTRGMASTEAGACTPMWAATAHGLPSGGYFAHMTPREPSALAVDDGRAEAMWDRSETWVAPYRVAS